MSLSSHKLMVYIFMLFINAATTEILYSTSYEYEGIYSRSITISFLTNFTVADNRAAKQFNYELGTTSVASGVEQDFRATSQVPTSLKSRLNASYDSQLQSYNLNIYNLQFADEYTFTVVLFYTINNDNTNAITSVKNFTLKIFGGPVLCPTQIPSNIEFYTNQTNNVTLTLCGNGEPRVVWYVDDTVPTNSVETTATIQKYEYAYTIAFPTITPAMCGKKLSYRATGYGEDMTGESIITVKFDPPLVQPTEAYLENLCTSVKWTLADIGSCTGIEYQIEYLLGVNNTAFVSTVSMTTDNYSYCVNDTSLYNITMVRIRSVYQQKYGAWSERKVSYQVITTAAVTTTNAAVTDSSTKEDDNTTIIIAGAVGGGCFILLLIFIGCCCYYCRNKKKKTTMELQNHSKHNHNDCPKNHESNGKHKKNNKASKDQVVIELPYNPPKPKPRVQNSSKNEAPPIAIRENDDDEVVYVAGIKYFDPEEFGMKTPQVSTRNTNEASIEGNAQDDSDSESTADYENIKKRGNENIQNQAANENTGYASDEFDSEDEDTLDKTFHPIYGAKV